MKRKLYFTAIIAMIIGSWSMVQAGYSSFYLINNSSQNLTLRFNGGSNISLKKNKSVSVPVSTTVTIQSNKGWSSWKPSSRSTSDTYEIIDGKIDVKVQAIQS